MDQQRKQQLEEVKKVGEKLKDSTLSKSATDRLKDKSVKKDE